MKMYKSKGCTHYSKMSGKMTNMIALGRDFCHECDQRMAIQNSVCSHCYAVKTAAVYKDLRNAVFRNNLLTPEDIHANPPKFCSPHKAWRSNWFGDYSSVNDVLVDWAICQANPDYTCVAFTKNLAYIRDALKVQSKPENYRVVRSSLMINKPDKLDIADIVFTVYTPQYAKEHNIEINCHGKSCVSCWACYGDDPTTYVGELLR